MNAESSLSPSQARAALEAVRIRQQEAELRRQKLQEQSEYLASRVVQLQRGKEALHDGMQPSAVDLPEAALQSFASGGQAQHTIAGHSDTTEAERAAELTMALEKQHSMNTYVRQQQQAQELNQRRLALQRQAEILEREEKELRRKHAQQKLANARAQRAASEARAAAEDEPHELEADEIDDDDFEGEIRAVETASAVRERLLSSYSRSEAKLTQRELAYRSNLADAERQREQGAESMYRGELGARSYSPGQLEAYKCVRSLTEEVVSGAIGLLHDDRRHGPTIPELQKEYENWQQAHQVLENRLAHGEDGDPVISIEDDTQDSAPQETHDVHDGNGRRLTTRGRLVDQLDAQMLWSLAGGLLESIVWEATLATAAQVKAELSLVSIVSNRLVLGSVMRSAGSSPSASPLPALQRIFADMTTRQRDMLDRRQPRALHAHRNNLTVRWRGRRPRKSRHDDESSSSSSDDDDDDKLGGVQTLSIDEVVEKPKSPLLRSLLTAAEGVYCSEMRVMSTFIPLKDYGSEPTGLQFAPSDERTLLAAGTQGGGVLVWHVDNGPAITPLRRLPRVRSELPNPILHLQWSNDCTELVTTDDCGLTRVWALSAHVPTLSTVSALRQDAHRHGLLQQEAEADAASAGASGNVTREAELRVIARQAATERSEAEQSASRQYGEALQSKLGLTGKLSASGQLSDQPHVLVEVSCRQLYHEQLSDSTNHVQAAPDTSKTNSSGPNEGAIGTGDSLAPSAGRKGARDRPGEKSKVLQAKEAAKVSAATEAAKDQPKRRGVLGFGRSSAVAPAPDVSGSNEDGSVVDATDAEKRTGPRNPPPVMIPRRERKWDDLYPLRCAFHPSFTLLGSQPSVMIAMRSGLISKVNRPAAQKVVQHAPPSRPRPLASKEEIRQAFGKERDRQAPTKNTAAAKDSEEPKFKSGGEAVSPSLSAETLTREYFTGHSSPVLLLGFVGQGGQMISLDADGLLLEWLYDSTHLSSYGWFTPRRSIQLGLALRMSCPDATSQATSVHFPTDRPTVRQPNDRTKKSVEKKAAEQTSSSHHSAAYLRAVQTHEKRRIWPLRLPVHPWRVVRHDNGHVTQMFGEPKDDAHESLVETITRDAGGTLLRHATVRYYHQRTRGALAAAALHPTCSDLAVLIRFGDEVPVEQRLRLQLIALDMAGAYKWRPLSVYVPQHHPSLPVQLSIGPFMDATACDYAYILVDNAVRIYSLGTGVQVRVVRPLHEELSPAINSLTVGGNGLFFSVACAALVPEHKAPGLWIYELVPPMRGTVSHARLLTCRTGSARHRGVPPEQRVRQSAFYLGVDRGGSLNDHAHILPYMRRTTEYIVESALERVDRAALSVQPTDAESGDEP